MTEILYCVCRMPVEAIEAFDPTDIKPEIVFGPSSMDACLLFAGSRLQFEYFLAESTEVT